MARKLLSAINLRNLAGNSDTTVIFLAALIASSPRFIRGVSCGHDFEFHLISWFETQRAWSQGILYPHWAQSPNWGAGEPRFIFYPPLTWMLGAALGSLMPWNWVPAALTFLFLAASGLATRALARQFLPAPSATLAGVIATATPYAFFTAYERTAFAELAAAAFVPLLLLFALRPSQSEESLGPPATRTAPSALYSVIPVSAVLAALWLTNAPAGVMASYLLAYAAFATALLQRSWKPLLRAAIAAPLGLGLAAFYLIPAAWEQRWIAIHQAIDVGERIADSWLFAHHQDPNLVFHDQVLQIASGILVLTTALALGALAVCLKQHKLPRATRHFWLPLALLIPILFLLQLPISTPLWSLPKLQFLQFPWRWLMVLGTPYAIFLAAAAPLASRRSRLWTTVSWTAILVIFTVIASRLFFQVCDEEDAVANQVTLFHNGAGVEGTDEYAPLDSDNSLVASGLPDACLVSDPTQSLGESDSGSEPVWYPEQGSCDDTFTAQLWQNEHKLLQIDSDHGGFAILRLRRYPAWQITVNGTSANLSTTREDGLTAVPIPAGPSTIEARWLTTPDVLWGHWISLGSLAAFLVLWIALRRAEHRRKTIQLSSNQWL
jgi:hypothetical protein